MVADAHSVRSACRVLDVSESTFFADRARVPSNRSIRHAWLTDLIVQAHGASRGTCAELGLVRPTRAPQRCGAGVSARGTTRLRVGDGSQGQPGHPEVPGRHHQRWATATARLSQGLAGRNADPDLHQVGRGPHKSRIERVPPRPPRRRPGRVHGAQRGDQDHRGARRVSQHPQRDRVPEVGRGGSVSRAGGRPHRHCGAPRHRAPAATGDGPRLLSKPGHQRASDWEEQYGGS